MKAEGAHVHLPDTLSHVSESRFRLISALGGQVSENCLLECHYLGTSATVTVKFRTWSSALEAPQLQEMKGLLKCCQGGPLTPAFYFQWDCRSLSFFLQCISGIQQRPHSSAVLMGSISLCLSNSGGTARAISVPALSATRACFSDGTAAPGEGLSVLHRQCRGPHCRPAAEPHISSWLPVTTPLLEPIV